jgi:hypothetical protein
MVDAETPSWIGRGRRQHRAHRAGRELDACHGRDRSRINAEKPCGALRRGVESQPARWVGEQRGQDTRRVTLDPDPRCIGSTA